ncbi:Glycoside hydrolase family 81 protein [Tolypocladium capitatum]|uniref:glucan endo-1,3-beta-D-glucosidase n=1 Tax=Tolypocladium capitatum TaxID=45235 RepID=A0A2K3QCY0_9HYPO|nr:Glycoside hydrolase family 81 protein [Tolypocladium capitatum]
MSFILARAFLLALASAGVTKGVFGPIDTGSAAGISGGQVACSSPPVSSFFSGINPPYPTNSWWAPYAAPPGTATAAGPFPYESFLDGHGIVFGISTTRQFDGTSIKQPTQTDWRVSFNEHSGVFNNHKATAFDTQSVTVQYFEGAATLTTYLVPGSPYLTFEYNGATPLFTPMNGGIQSFNGQSLSPGQTASATGTTFTVTDTKGSTYLIYALTALTLTATSASPTSGSIVAGGQFNGVLRFVMLSQPGHQVLLDQHYQVYPTSVQTDYSFSADSATLTFNWNTIGDGTNLLMLTWPHHRLTLQNANFPDTSALGYLTTKGWMYPAIGNQWNMLYQLSPITWSPPRPLDPSCTQSVLQGLVYQIGQLNASAAPIPNEFYFWGGTLAAEARLALIADIINPSPADPYFPITRCRDWFTGHSWASGVANGAGSRDQESSGEGINGYYGALLWASVALSQDYVNYAKLLLATEQHAAHVYWHLNPQQSATDRDNPYPEQEVRNLVTMGNVMDWQSGAFLFWGNQKVEIAAIQILPVTPANEVLYDNQWVTNMWSYTMPELVNPAISDD